MADAHAEVSARPVGGRGQVFLRHLVGLRHPLRRRPRWCSPASGWFIELGAPKDAADAHRHRGPHREGAAAVGHLLRPGRQSRSRHRFSNTPARSACSPRFSSASDCWRWPSARACRTFSTRSSSAAIDVVIGSGPAAQEYAAAHNAHVQGQGDPSRRRAHAHGAPPRHLAASRSAQDAAAPRPRASPHAASWSTRAMTPTHGRPPSSPRASARRRMSSPTSPIRGSATASAGTVRATSAPRRA